MAISFSRITKRLWNSPTFTTWGSFIASSVNFVIVLPLLLTHLTIEEIAVWYLFKVIVNLRQVADFGVGVTFTRSIAYAMGGVSDLESIEYSTRKNLTSEPSWNTIEKIISTMNVIYLIITLIFFLLAITFGSLALIQPISKIADPGFIWFAWIALVVFVGIYVNGNKYSAILQGMNQIPLYRRWEAFFTSLSIIASFIILVLKGNLATLVFGTQIWMVLNVWLNKYLCQKLVRQGSNLSFTNRTIYPDIFRVAWPRAWKSGIGQMFSYGITQISGLIYAQIGDTAQVAAYLLGLQFMNAIVGIAKAPFYSKIPLLSRLFSEGRKQELLNSAKRGIAQAHWLYVIGFSGIGILAPYFLDVIGSNASFPNRSLWVLLGIGFFSERYGAMHLQLFSITNIIVWHIANGVSGTIYILVSFAMLSSLGILAFPVGYIAGYLGFYAWYCAHKAYKYYGFNFWRFEKSTFLVPLLLFVVSILIQLL